MSRLVRAGAAGAVATAALAAWNARRLPVPVAAGTRVQVPVLVPARDEAATIAECVESCAVNTGGEVVVLDDGSADATAALAAAGGARVVTGSPPPPGWLGKAWACEQLVRATDGDVIVLVDADVRLRPGAVAAARAALGDAELATVFPRQRAVGVERLVQPLLTWTWLATLPLPAAQRSPRPSLTAACGQFLLVRRDALERIGGFKAVRGDVLDDIALARAIKAAGGRVVIASGRDVAATRMYEGWPALRDGYGKSLWSAFGSPAGAVAVVAATAVVWVLPAVAAVCGSRAGLAGYLAAVASRVVSGRVAGDRVWPDALVHPASVAVLDYLTLHSVVMHRRRRTSWRGRPV